MMILTRPTFGNLPLSLNSFIGREQEIKELEPLLTATRLLTLTGAGGCGKTRLALHLATDSIGIFDDGAWWVELASVTDAALLPQAILQVLGLPDLPNRLPLYTLTDYFQSKHALLILDNCEHVIDACAKLILRLLQACPHLNILATSREALNIDGERAWPVPSLRTPALDSPDEISDLDRSEAVYLFVERASTVAPDFKLVKQNAAAVARICRRLDGIPLAIELAAARVKVLQVEQIADRLDNALHLLSQGKRNAPHRHQTLRATMDWSYNLLSEAEKMLFRRLSVFAESFTLEAAEAVCIRAGMDHKGILEFTASLVNKSLLVRVGETTESRYRFLEPVRQYAHEKLVEAGEGLLLKNCHLSYFHDWAQAIEPKIHTAEQLTCLARLERELDNFRAALQWALETQPVMALRIVAALTFFWNIRGYTTEGRRWGDQALMLTNGESAPEVFSARAWAMSAVAFLTMTQGDYQSANYMITDAIAMLRTQNDRQGLARALYIQATVSSFLGQWSMVRAPAEESLSIGNEIDDPFVLVNTLGTMSVLMFQMGEMAAGKHFVEEMLAKSRQIASPWWQALSLWGAARGSIFLGDLKMARVHSQESLALFRQIGDKHRINMTASALADIFRKTGNLHEAQVLYIEVMQGWRDYGQPGGIARCIECLAFIALSKKHDAQATRWLGAAQALRESAHSRMIPAEQDEYEREVAVLRKRMNDDNFISIWSEGQTLTMQQVIVEVEQLSAKPTAQTPNLLTTRELDVLRLLVQGLSDAQIAEKLVVSRRTVTTHLTTIYSKLGVNSRSAAMRYALDHKLI